MKLEFSQQIFGKNSNIKVDQNPSSGSRVVPCGQKHGQTDRWTEGHDEANSRFSQFCEKRLNICTPLGQNAEFLDVFEKLRKATVSFVMSVCRSTSNDSHPTRRILMKFYFRALFESLSRISKFLCTLHEDVRTFMTVYTSERNISDKIIEKRNTHFILNIFF